MCQMDIPHENTSCSDFPDMANYSYIDWYLDNDIEIDSILRNARRQLLPVLKPVTLILSLIGIIGIVGNILVILVFSRTFQKQASTYLVLMLAITDLIACSLVIPGTLLKEWFVNIQNDIMCKVAELLRHFVIISSAMILVAIAFDRFWMVYKRSSDNNKKLSLVMMLIIVFVALTFAVPSMLRVGVYRLLPNGKLININICAANDLLISVEDYAVHWNIITAVFGLLLGTIIALYTLIFIMVYKHRNKNLSKHRQPNTNLQVTSTNQHRKMLSLLPFVRPNPTEQQKSFLSSRFKKTSQKSLKSSRLTLNRVTRVLHPQAAPTPDQIVQINIINNSSSTASLSDQDKRGDAGADRAKPGTSQSNNKMGTNLTTAQPGTSQSNNKMGTNLTTAQSGISQSNDKLRTNLTAAQPGTSQSNDKLGTNLTTAQPGTSQSNDKLGTNLTAAQPGTSQSMQSPIHVVPSVRNVVRKQTLLPQSQRTAHIKTTQVLCIITLVYVAAFLPMFLITHNVINNNMIVFYLYFINNAANPIIYSFMNRKFRQDIWKMFSCRRSSVWPVG